MKTNPPHGRRIPGCCVLIAFAVGWSAGARAAPADPGPPVGVSGAGQPTYTVTEKRFGDTGYVLLQLWTFRFEASDAHYVIQQAHLVLEPTRTDTTVPDDIEDLRFDLPNPAPFECELIQWEPKLNGSGVTLSGSINVDSTPGLNVGGETTIGVEGTQVERAGKDGLHGSEGDAEWDIDFDDFSLTPSGRVALDFYAAWRCPKDALMIPGMPSLKFEIDVWGRADPVYELLYLDPDVTDETPGEYELSRNSTRVAALVPAPTDDAPLSVVVEPPSERALVPGGAGTFKVRLYSRAAIESATGSIRFAETDSPAATLSQTLSGREAGLAFVELRARARIPDAAGASALSPRVTLNAGGRTWEHQLGAIPVLREARLGTTVPLGPGVHVVRVRGRPGEVIRARFDPSGGVIESAIRPRFGSRSSATPFEGNALVATASEVGPVLEFRVAGGRAGQGGAGSILHLESASPKRWSWGPLILGLVAGVLLCRLRGRNAAGVTH